MAVFNRRCANLITRHGALLIVRQIMQAPSPWGWAFLQPCGSQLLQQKRQVGFEELGGSP